jgi:hypothetical protein
MTDQTAASPVQTYDSYFKIRAWNKITLPSTDEGAEVLKNVVKEQLARFYNRCLYEEEDEWEDYRDWITETRDPIEAFDGRNWRESSGKITDDGSDIRFPKTTMIFFERVQVAKGQPRQNIAVADAGEVRLVITDA